MASRDFFRFDITSVPFRLDLVTGITLDHSDCAHLASSRSHLPPFGASRHYGTGVHVKSSLRLGLALKPAVAGVEKPETFWKGVTAEVGAIWGLSSVRRFTVGSDQEMAAASAWLQTRG